MKHAIDKKTRGSQLIVRKAITQDYEAVKMLYVSAFPLKERIPFFFIKRRALQNRATLLIAEENGEFIGFAYTISYGNLVYLFYLAVAEDKRSGGNGSKILSILKTRFKDKQVFLELEPLDEAARNSQERVRRHDFYIRNGFIDLPFQIKEIDGVYDVMSTQKNLDPADYDALIRNWAGKLVAPFMKVAFIK